LIKVLSIIIVRVNKSNLNSNLAKTMEVVPVNFGLKYRPPKLGVQYYIKNQPNAHFVHEISLAMVDKGTNVDHLISDLFESNKFYLNPKVVSQG
jgi:hypothetical protein